MYSHCASLIKFRSPQGRTRNFNINNSLCWLYFWGLFLEQRRSSVVMFGCVQWTCIKITFDRVKILNKGLNSAKTVSTLPTCSLIRCFRERESIWSVIENVIKKKRTKSLGVSWLCGSSQKLVFLLIASLQKVIQWTTNAVTQTLNYETVAKVEGKMKKVLKQKEEI